MARKTSERHFRSLERMYHRAAINEVFQPELTVGDGMAEVTIPVRPELFHAAGAVHGSVYFKALDDAAFFAVNSRVSDVFVLTVSFTIYMTRPVAKGILRARGRLTHESKRLFLAEAELFDSRKRQIARGSGSFMRSTIALSPELGYE
jgi:uncharacterized protein (TIGR00369 family)